MAATDGDGALYRSERQRSGMTQEHLAGAAMLSVRTIRRAEAGDRIGYEARRSICAVLGLDVARTVPDLPSRRPMHDDEIVFRIMAIKIFSARGRGGLHPLLLMSFIVSTMCMAVTVNPVPLTVTPVILMSMLGLARRNGLTPTASIDFVMGRRFLDGTPTEIDDRLSEMYLRRGYAVTTESS